MQCYGGCFGISQQKDEQLGGHLGHPSKLKDTTFLQQQQQQQRSGSPISDCSDESRMTSSSETGSSNASCYAADASTWKPFDQAPKQHQHATLSKVSNSCQNKPLLTLHLI